MNGQTGGASETPEPKGMGVLFWALLLYAAGMAVLAVEYIVNQTYLLY